LKLVYLSLGSNIGDRELHLRTALEQIESPNLHILRISPIYETEPVDYADQRWFLNQVVEAETALFPFQLLAQTQKIERALGRVRTVPKGPRTIDIDILLYGKAVMHTPSLEIPHPAMAKRRFVLTPLADLAPNLRHPVTQLTVRQMLDAAPMEKLRAYSPE